MSLASDPFQLLGLPPRFDLDSAELERRQRELSVARHVDGPHALEALNDAVRTLKDPLSRAERLFQLRGWSLRANADPATLERVFAEREQIDAWRREHNLEALRHWLGEIAAPRQRELLVQLCELLDTAPSQQRVNVQTRALQLLERLRYDIRAAAAARAAIDALEE